MVGNGKLYIFVFQNLIIKCYIEDVGLGERFMSKLRLEKRRLEVRVG
jgi:hypothetical protein